MPHLPATRILVVDDEPHQLDTICRGLTLYDHACTGVHDAGEALDVLRNSAEFAMLITDLSLPGRAGLDLVECVRREYPDLPILVLVGLNASAEIASVREKRIHQLAKPFDPDTLAAAVQRLLEGRPDPPSSTPEGTSP